MKPRNSNSILKLPTFLLIPVFTIFLSAFTEGKQTTEDTKKNLHTFFKDRKQTGMLFVVDGIKQDSMYIENLDLHEIESYTILQKSFGIDFYGEEGKRGVVLVTTKEEANKENKTKEGLTEDQVPLSRISEIRKRPAEEFWVKVGKESTKLIVIDGVISDQKGFFSLNTSMIETFNVLKDSAAIAKYGEKGKDGAILITTKKEANKETRKKVKE